MRAMSLSLMLFGATTIIAATEVVRADAAQERAGAAQEQPIALTDKQRTELQPKLEHMLQAYAQGLLDRSLTAEDNFLSSYLKLRITGNYKGEAANRRLTEGIERERRKLKRRAV